MEHILKVTDTDIERILICDKEGNPRLDENGNKKYIEIDLEDIELPLKINKAEYLIKKAGSTLKTQMVAINKKEDHKGERLLSSNQEEQIKAMKEYFNSMEEAIDSFLGEGATNKIFGKRRYYEMWDNLGEWLEPIMPQIKNNTMSIADRIKNKYKNTKDNVLSEEML